MSHLNVVVIGPCPEQLARFSEELEVEPYYEAIEEENIQEAKEGLGFSALASCSRDATWHEQAL